MSEEEKLLKEAKKLPWEDRLLHKNWKVRNEANIDLAALCDSIADPKDSRLRDFGMFSTLLVFQGFGLRSAFLRFLMFDLHFRSAFQEDSCGFQCACAREGARRFDCVFTSCRFRCRQVCLLFSLSFVLVCLLVKLRNLDWYLVMLKVCQGSMRCNCGEMPHRQDEDSGESSGGIHALDRIGGSRPVFGALSLSLSLAIRICCL